MQAGNAAALLAEVVFRLQAPPQALQGNAPEMFGLIEGEGGQPVACFVQADGKVTWRYVFVLGYVMEMMDQDMLDAMQ